MASLPGAQFKIYEQDTSAVVGTTDTLNGNINASVTAIVLTSGIGTVSGTVISIGTEHIYIVSGGGTPNLTVIRGWAGTTAASHTSGATVNVPGALSFTLLPISQITPDNNDFVVVKKSTDINYVQVLPWPGTMSVPADTLQSGATAILLIDASAAYGTTRLVAPDSTISTCWIQTAGVGGSGSGGSGGGGSAASPDTAIQINKGGVLGTDTNLTWPYATGGGLVAGGPGTTNASQFIRDIGTGITAGGMEGAIYAVIKNTLSAVVGNGPSFVLAADNSAGTKSFMAHIGSLWVNSTAGSEASSIAFALRANSADAFAETLCLTIAPTLDATFYGNLLANGGSQSIGSFAGNWWANIYGTFTFANYLVITNNLDTPYYKFGPGSGPLSSYLVLLGNTTSGTAIMSWSPFLISSYANLCPSVNNGSDLGSVSLYWNHGYITNLNIGGIGSDKDIVYNKSGALAADNNLSWDYTGQNLTVAGGILDPTGTHSIGSFGTMWEYVYAATLVTQSITLAYGGTTVALIGWNSSLGAVSIVKNPSQILVEFDFPTTTFFSNLVPNVNNGSDLGSTGPLFWAHSYITSMYGNALYPIECGLGGFPATPVGSYGGIAYQAGSVYSYWNGSAWESADFSLISSMPGADTDLLYNKAGIPGADGNLTWNYSGQFLTVNGNILAGGGSDTLGAFSGNWWSSIFGTNVYANQLIVTNNSLSPYYRFGFSGSLLALVGPTSGSATIMSWSASQIVSAANVVPSANNGADLGTPSLYWNHLYVTNLVTSSVVTSLNSLGGALSITNGGTTNEISVSASGTSIALTLPQQIGTGSNPQFGSPLFTGNLTVDGNVQAGSTGSIGTSSNWWSNIYGTDVFANLLIISNTSFSPYYRFGFSGSNLTLIGPTSGSGAIMSWYSSLVTSYANIVPSTNNGADLGSSSLFWDHLYCSNLYTTLVGIEHSSLPYTVIDSSGNVISYGGFFVNAGFGGATYTGQTVNVVGVFTIGGTSYTNLVFRGGILVSYF